MYICCWFQLNNTIICFTNKIIAVHVNQWKLADIWKNIWGIFYWIVGQNQNTVEATHFICRCSHESLYLGSPVAFGQTNILEIITVHFPNSILFILYLTQFSKSAFHILSYSIHYNHGCVLLYFQGALFLGLRNNTCRETTTTGEAAWSDHTMVPRCWGCNDHIHNINATFVWGSSASLKPVMCITHGFILFLFL